MFNGGARAAQHLARRGILSVRELVEQEATWRTDGWLVPYSALVDRTTRDFTYMKVGRTGHAFVV